MRIDILTLFPEIVEGPLKASLLGKALEAGALEVMVTNIRDFATDRHRTVDDAPYGGGAGMVMRCEPVEAALESLHGKNSLRRVILLSPRGRRLDQALVRELAQQPDLVLLCARYEGMDERVSETLCTEEISIGDYVLTNGTVAAAIVIDALSRFIPGTLGEEKSLTHESFTNKLLDFPQYTRPAEFRGMSVPEVLLSGNHVEIEKWRQARRLEKTRQIRPDLLE